MTFSSFDVFDDDEADIRHALIYGDFTSAVQRCLQTGRLADAIIFSSFGPPHLWEETRTHYFSVHPHPFIRHVMRNVSSSNLEEMVASSTLTAAPSSSSASASSWKETLAILITYTTTDRYRSLVNQLAERLEAAGHALPALICYMCSSNVDKAVDLFSRQVTENADPVVQLHTAMEKIAVFAQATSAHLQQPPSPLLSLKYSEYATLLASQGFIVGAWNYLRVSNPSGTDPASAVLLDRLYHASYASDQPIQQQPPAFPFHPIANVGIDGALAQVENAYEMNKRQREALVHASQQHAHAQTHHTPQMHPQPHPSQHPHPSHPQHPTPGYPPTPQQPQQPQQPTQQFGPRPTFPPQQPHPGYTPGPTPGQVHPPTPYPAGVYNPSAAAQAPHLPSQPYATQPYAGRPGQPQQPQPLPPQQSGHPSHPHAPAPPQPGYGHGGQSAYPPQPGYPQPPPPQPQPPQQPQYPQHPTHPQQGQMGHAGPGGPSHAAPGYQQGGTPAYPPQPTAPPSTMPPPTRPMQPQTQAPQPPPQQQSQPGYPPQQGVYHGQGQQPSGGPGGYGSHPHQPQPPAQHPHYGQAQASPTGQQHPPMPPPGQPHHPPQPQQQAYDGYGQPQHQQQPQQQPQPSMPQPPPAPTQPRVFNPAAQAAQSAPPPTSTPAYPPAQPAALPQQHAVGAPAAAPAASLSQLSFSPECQQLVSVLESHYEQLTSKAAPTEQRKIADLHNRLMSLYPKLALPQSQSLSPSLLGELSALCQCVMAGDYNGCKRHHTALVKNDWTGNNEWILALKSFLDLWRKYCTQTR